MSKYSNLFFSDKEYYEILPFRFPIYKDLVAGEAEGVESIARDQAQNTYTLLKIAKQLSKKKKISVKDALDILSDADSDNEVIYDYAEELAEVQRKGSTVAEQEIEMVTLFIKFRGEVEQGADWKAVSDWTREDTLAMPTKLMSDVFEFVNWERNGWPEEGK